MSYVEPELEEILFNPQSFMLKQNFVAFAKEFHSIDKPIPECGNRTLHSIIQQFLALEPPTEIIDSIREVIKSDDVRICAKEMWDWIEMAAILDEMKNSRSEPL